ncbi:hypothetical protein ASE74_20855 [Pedobacter sp. Leaf216]|nr:hypothetical protein ASE74_20855 [Pedobacter sp. Leaf216]
MSTMKTNFSLLFYLKRQKNYQSGPVAIYMRITVNGKRVEITSGRSCEPSQWNTVNGRSSGKKEDSKSLNAYLDDLQFKIHEAHRQLTLHNEEVTAISIRDRFLGKQGNHHTIIGVFKEHNRKLEILIGSEYTKGTAERYRTSLKHHLIRIVIHPGKTGGRRKYLNNHISGYLFTKFNCHKDAKPFC